MTVLIVFRCGLSQITKKKNNIQNMFVYLGLERVGIDDATRSDDLPRIDLMM